MRDRLLEVVYAHDELADLDPAQRRLALRSLVTEAGGTESSVADIADTVDGFGPLTSLLADDSITDVLVNGPAEVWVERAGALERTEVVFPFADQLGALVERLIGEAGERVDASEPIASARLRDGSRVHAVLPPVAPGGPLLSIRRHPVRALGLDDLVRRATLCAAEAEGLADAVRARRNIAVSGATGTGKTTLLNALLACIPPGERVVTIEETRELRPACSHAVSLVARATNLEGRGGIGLERLAREALRMRPDRIVVGEVRGPEARVALEAMSTGHEGSMVTLHARSASETVGRMAALALRGSPALPEASVLAEVRSALDVVVYLRRDEGGLRRVAEIAEMT
jgi:pilus assembly protein CpaF